ncbi:unnamed protein product, partial [Polarella glacialis]
SHFQRRCRLAISAASVLVVARFVTYSGPNASWLGGRQRPGLALCQLDGAALRNRRVVGTSPRKALANSSQEDIARPPSWRDTLRGATFWANPNNWEKIPSSWSLKWSFIFLKVVGTIGGYRGRAAFARRSGIRPLLNRRADAASVVDKTTNDYMDCFPKVAASLREAAKPALLFEGLGPAGITGLGSSPALAVVLPVFAATPEH